MLWPDFVKRKRRIGMYLAVHARLKEETKIGSYIFPFFLA